MNGLPEKKQKKSNQLSVPEPTKPVSTPKQTKAEKVKAKEASKQQTPVLLKGGPKEANKATPSKDSKKTPGKEGKKEAKTPVAGEKKAKVDNKENVETPKQKKNKEGKKGSEQKTPS